MQSPLMIGSGALTIYPARAVGCLSGKHGMVYSDGLIVMHIFEPFRFFELLQYLQQLKANSSDFPNCSLFAIRGNCQGFLDN